MPMSGCLSIMPKNRFHRSMFFSNTAFISAVSISSFFSAQSHFSPQLHFSSHMPVMQAQSFMFLPSITQGQVSSMVCASSVPDGFVQQAEVQQAEAAPMVVSIHSASSSAIQVFFIENVLRFFSVIISPRLVCRLDSLFPLPRGSDRSGS